MADLDLILTELRGFRQENKVQLEGIKEEIRKANTRLDEAEERIEKTEERIQNTEEVMTEMLKLHVSLADKLMDLESRSRRENVRIYGVPEGMEKDSPTMASFVERLLREGLELAGEVPDLQIERAHRSLGPQPPEEAPPRSIVVKFQSFKTKEFLLRKAWQRKGFTRQKHQINLDHDYPPLILKMRREYAEVRRVLKEKQVPFQTLFPARLRVRHSDGIKTYDTIEEATEDLNKRGYNVNVIRRPTTMMEQIQQLTWRKVVRPPRKAGPKPGAGPDAGYKDKLRQYRRSSPAPPKPGEVG